MLDSFNLIKEEKHSRQKLYAKRVLAGVIPAENRCVLVGCRKSKVKLLVPESI